MGICKLCRREKPLVEAHIIPESMYPFEKGLRQPLLKVPTNPAVPLGKTRVGEYDPALVCACCEAKFSPWDDYALRVFRKEPEAKDYIDAERSEYELKTFDYVKFKLFFVSLLWRASETTRRFFEKVSVGPRHTERLREMILNNDPGNPDEYAVCLVRFTDPDDADKSIGTPHEQRFKQIRFYRFYVTGYTCAIKVDRRPVLPGFSEYTLRQGKPLRITEVKFRETPEFPNMLRGVRGHKPK